MNYEGAITPASIKLPSAPTRANHVFQGWTDVANSETAKWSANQTVTFENTENTVYAAWKNWLYHCNWCNQDTNQIHYRCPTHYVSQTCTTTSNKTCSVSSGTCGATVCTSGVSSSAGNTFGMLGAKQTCAYCGKQLTDSSKKTLSNLYMRQQTTSIMCPKGHTVTQNSSSGYYSAIWCQSHGTTLLCPNNKECGKAYTPNYRSY